MENIEIYPENKTTEENQVEPNCCLQNNPEGPSYPSSHLQTRQNCTSSPCLVASLWSSQRSLWTATPTPAVYFDSDTKRIHSNPL